MTIKIRTKLFGIFINGKNLEYLELSNLLDLTDLIQLKKVNPINGLLVNDINRLNPQSCNKSIPENHRLPG